MSALPPELAKGGPPRIAILVADLGDRPADARNAIALLPRSFGIGLSPYGSALGPLAQAARAKGHEVWVGVAMQPKRYPAIDPGKNALLLSQPGAENVRRFGWALDQVPGPKAGFYNMMGSGFTAKAGALTPVLAVARLRQLGFVDARSDTDTNGPAAAQATGARAVLSRGYIDDPADQLGQRLDALVATARKDGEAVALVSGSPASIATLVRWSATATASGIELVSPGQLTRKR